MRSPMRECVSRRALAAAAAAASAAEAAAGGRAGHPR